MFLLYQQLQRSSCPISLFFDKSAHLRIVLLHFFLLQLQAPQQVLQSFLLLNRQSLINLSLLFVQLHDEVDWVIAASMGSSLLSAPRTQVLFASKTVTVKALLMRLAKRQSVQLIDSFYLVSLQNFSPVMIRAASLTKIKSFSFAVQSCLLIFAANADKLCKIELSFLPNSKVGLVSQLILLVRA